jgi:hypothetical protein
MLALLTGLAGQALEYLLGRLFGPKEPTAIDLAASNASAQTQLAQEQTAHEIIAQAAAVRTDADARVLRESAEPAPAGSAPALTPPSTPTRKDTGGIDPLCAVLRPIALSHADTDGTKAQAIAQNEVIDKACGDHS